MWPILTTYIIYCLMCTWRWYRCLPRDSLKYIHQAKRSTLCHRDGLNRTTEMMIGDALVATHEEDTSQPDPNRITNSLMFVSMGRCALAAGILHGCSSWRRSFVRAWTQSTEIIETRCDDTTCPYQIFLLLLCGNSTGRDLPNFQQVQEEIQFQCSPGETHYYHQQHLPAHILHW